MNKYEAIQPARPDFRDQNLDIKDAFTWTDGITEDTGPDGLYVVQFWSDRGELPQESVDQLIAHDKAAYLEAKWAFPDDFLLYWCDNESPNGVSKSMCLWTAQKHARGALQLPEHRAAVRFMCESSAYRTYDVRGFILHKAGVELTFTKAA